MHNVWSGIKPPEKLSWILYPETNILSVISSTEWILCGTNPNTVWINSYDIDYQRIKFHGSEPFRY